MGGGLHAIYLSPNPIDDFMAILGSNFPSVLSHQQDSVLLHQVGITRLLNKGRFFSNLDIGILPKPDFNGLYMYITVKRMFTVTFLAD